MRYPGATSTEAVHAGTDRVRPYHTLSPSITQTATYTFESTADLVRFMRGDDPDRERQEYARYGTPTLRELERRVARLEGADDAVGFATGMTALHCVLLALLGSGAHLVMFRDCYRRTRQLVCELLARFGVEQTVVEPADLARCEQALRPETGLIFAESPTNPYLFCTDLEKLAELGRQHRVVTVIDATMATPVNCRPLSFGVDLVVHSATKYLGGHNDVLGGVVAGRQSLIDRIRELRGIVGDVMDPHAAFLIGRGLKTLALRVGRQNETALRVARMLERHPRVSRVYYPWLESHPTFSTARSQMSGGGGVISFVIEGGREAAARVVDGCRLAQIAPSFGGVETLIEQPANQAYFDCSEAELAEIGIEPGLIRLAVGIEEADDILADLENALAG